MVVARVGSSVEAAEAFVRSSSTVTPGLSAAESSFWAPCPEIDRRSVRMHATIRSYTGVDQNRKDELTRKVNETLLPQLHELPGFISYYLVDANNGVFTSVGLFETPDQGLESTKLVSRWIRDEKLETLIPSEPKIMSGKIIAHSDRVLVA
jgi:hypothetical protein